MKCYYDAPEQRLTVEILHAADLIALDANGKKKKRFVLRAHFAYAYIYLHISLNLFKEKI